MMRKLSLPCSLTLFLFLAALITAPLFAQTTETLPDAPGALVDAPSSSLADPVQEPSGGPQHAATPATHEDPQQKRIFGIIPNFKSVTACRP